MPELTPQQRRAVLATDGSVIVSAAAGSGKTSVLAERCARLVCDADPDTRCDADALLVLTFTEAAAAEMRARIRQRIVERCAAEPLNPHLQRQLLLLDDAHITTIDAFCLWLVRQEFVHVDIDPGVAIIEPDHARLLLIETIDAVFARRQRANDDTTRALRHLLAAYAGHREAALIDTLLRLHGFMRTLADPSAWIADTRANLHRQRSAVVAIESASLQAGLERQHRLTTAVARSPLLNTPAGQRWIEELDAYAGQVAQWRARCTAETFAATCEWLSAVQFAKGSAKRGRGVIGDAERHATWAGDARKQVVKAHDDLVKRFTQFTVDEWHAGLQAVAGPTGALLDLIDEIDVEYAAAKRRRQVLDFSDAEYFAHALLHPERGAPGVAAALRHRFRYVLIDEFQDVNPLQEAIIVALSREPDHTLPNNLFCVGDIKQSIYGFRHAEPQLIAERSRQADDGAAGHDSVRLSTNFRSTPRILDAVNRICGPLLTPGLSGCTYDDEARLVPGDPAADPGPPVELHLIDQEARNADEEWDSVEQQALWMAERITTLCRDDGHRPADIVILLRAAKRAERIAAILRHHGIPALSGSGPGFFDTLEVRDVLALLAVLDNPEQDIPLTAVLRSGMAGSVFDERDLYVIRQAAPHGPFYRAVHRYARTAGNDCAQRLTTLLDRLHGYRVRMSRDPLPVALMHVIDDTGMLATLAGRPGGEQRRANVLQLHQRAVAFARQDTAVGVQRFLEFLERLSADARAGSREPLVETDAVRIMTVHQSKGLEFPVVFHANIDRTFLAVRDDILADRHEGLGVMAVDLPQRIKYHSLASRRVKQRLSESEQAEELRILYVALTRAKRRLILVGSTKQDVWQGLRARWHGHGGALPDLAILAAAAPAEWVLSALATAPGGVHWPDADREHPSATVRVTTSDPLPAIDELRPPTDRARRYAALESVTPTAPDDPRITAVFRRLDLLNATPHRAVPAVISVSELVHRPTAHDAPAPQPAAAPMTRWARPTFLRAAGALTAAEIGTATHRFLQRLDYAPSVSLAAQHAAAVDGGWLTRAEAERIDLDAIQWFLDSAWGDRVRAAIARHREVPLLMRIPVTEYDERQSSATADDFVTVRGMVDLLLDESHGWTVVDFKTDRIPAAAIPERLAVYRLQVRQYAMGIAGVWGRRPHQGAVVFLGPRQVETIDVTAAADPPGQLELWPG